MSLIKFSDGEVFDTSGPIRKELRSDGWYVIGEGCLIPVASEEAADQYLLERRQVSRL